MEDYGYIKHAIMLLSGIDEETGLPKVHPDNFLTNEQIKAVQDLITFVKMQCKFMENPESDLGLTMKPISVANILDILNLSIKTEWVNNCRLFVTTDHGDPREAYCATLCTPNFPTNTTYRLYISG